MKQSGKLILTEFAFGSHKRDIALFVSTDRMEYLKVLPDEDTLSVGTILIGKCRHQVPNIPAAFFALNKEGDIGFLSTKTTDHLKVLNRPFQGKLADGDEVLLQVRREKLKTKEYAVSGRIELQGRFCVAKFGSGRLFFSRNHQQSTKDIISSYFRQKALCAPNLTLIGYPEYDLVLRTRAERMTGPDDLDTLCQDCADTLKALNSLVLEASSRSCFSVLEKPAKRFENIVSDLSACGFHVDEFLTDSYRLYISLQEELRTGAQIRYYQDDQVSLPVLYHISSRVEEALSTKVWLKNGGYLCIEQTEAMTVVDVNTGKATSGKDSEKLFFETNLEAASEMLRQLRIRNITGMIVADFINMTDHSHEEAVLALMKEQAVHDYQKIHIYEFTKLGLLEMTREKRGKSLKECL